MSWDKMVVTVNEGVTAGSVTHIERFCNSFGLNSSQECKGTWQKISQPNYQSGLAAIVKNNLS